MLFVFWRLLTVGKNVGWFLVSVWLDWKQEKDLVWLRTSAFRCVNCAPLNFRKCHLLQLSKVIITWTLVWSELQGLSSAQVPWWRAVALPRERLSVPEQSWTSYNITFRVQSAELDFWLERRYIYIFWGPSLLKQDSCLTKDIFLGDPKSWSYWCM